jgi:hypothetical protein
VTQKARVHDYLSTYCWHENHDDCRRECKTCRRPCRCECHSPQQGLKTATVDPSTANIGRKSRPPKPGAVPRQALMGLIADSVRQWEGIDTLAVANSMLANTELLDAIVAYRQEQDRRFTARQIQDAVLAVLDTRQVSLWLEHPQNTTTPCGSLHPEDAGHVARWVAETLTDITEEPNV